MDDAEEGLTKAEVQARFVMKQHRKQFTLESELRPTEETRLTTQSGSSHNGSMNGASGRAAASQSFHFYGSFENQPSYHGQQYEIEETKSTLGGMFDDYTIQSDRNSAAASMTNDEYEFVLKDEEDASFSQKPLEMPSKQAAQDDAQSGSGDKA